MKPTGWRTPPPRLLAAYVEGELAASESAAVERFLSESSNARRQIQELRAIVATLSDPGHEFDGVDLLPSINARIREHSTIRVRASEGLVGRIWRWPAAALFATALVSAAVCLALVRAPVSHPAEEFRAKTARQTTAASARWAGVQAYRVVGQAGSLSPGGLRARRPERLGETLARGDGLLFSYTNLGRQPFANLMIFAVDSAGKVHWFHPGYEHEGMNPRSIGIEKGAAEVPLAELIQDQFPSGPLVMHALFSNQSLQVLEVEAWLKSDPQTSLVARVPGSVDQVFTTRVEP